MLALKAACSVAATILTLVGFYPYLRDILARRTQPHVFSWVIWAATTLVVFLAQLAAGAGIGAWPIGVSGSVTALIALIAWRRRADITITRTDRFCLAAALSALPAWALTADPLWAVVILTAVDLLGFGPTLRKAWQAPQSESPGFFALFALRNLLVVGALEAYSLTTVLFPLAVALACLVVVALLWWRRRQPVAPVRPSP